MTERFIEKPDKKPNFTWTEAIKWPHPDSGCLCMPRPDNSDKRSSCESCFVVFVVWGLILTGYPQLLASLWEGRQALKYLWHMKEN